MHQKELKYFLVFAIILAGIGVLLLYFNVAGMLGYLTSENNKESRATHSFLLPQDMIDDFRKLTQVIKETHPNPYAFFPEDEFRKEEQRLSMLRRQ